MDDASERELSFDDHDELIVKAPKGNRYRIRLERTSVHRWHPLITWSLERWAFTRLRYAYRHQSNWTVRVMPVSAWRIFYPPLLDEDHPNRAAAAARAGEIADEILDGTTSWPGPWQRR